MSDPDPRRWPAGTAHEHLQVLAECYRSLPGGTLVTVPLEVVRILVAGQPGPSRGGNDG